MKPASIISLIVSVLLIVVGLVTCIVAQNMANANGEALFSEMKSDGIVKTVDLTDTDFSKLELLVSDAEINIYGKSKTSYIEFINFRENYYTLSTANKVLSFDEIPDVISMLKFWENGFSFKGMRHIFQFKQDADTKKTINVYLGSDLNIKIFNISADNCTLNLENLTSASDYNLKITNGEIYANTLKTTSALKVEGKNIKLAINAAVLSVFELTADHAEVLIDSFRVSNSANVTVGTGEISLTSPFKITELNFDLSTKTGHVSVNGVDRGTEAHNANGHDTDGLINIKTESADISLRQNSLSGGIIDRTDETTDETTSE